MIFSKIRMFLNYYPENFVIETLIIFVIIFLFLYRNINTIVYPTIVFICAIIVTFMYQNSELEKILDNVHPNKLFPSNYVKQIEIDMKYDVYIKRQLNELAEQFNELYETEREISQEMFKKYGKGEVDMEQGTFVNIED